MSLCENLQFQNGFKDQAIGLIIFSIWEIKKRVEISNQKRLGKRKRKTYDDDSSEYIITESANADLVSFDKEKDSRHCIAQLVVLIIKSLLKGQGNLSFI